MEDIQISDKSIVISPKDFITVVDQHSQFFAVACLSWFFNEENSEATLKIVSDFVEHLNKKK